MGRKIACFTKEQQEAYDKLNSKQQLYLDYRSIGYKRSDAYRAAGYNAKDPRRKAYDLEHNNNVIGTLVQVLLNHSMAKHAMEMDLIESSQKAELADTEHKLNALQQQADDAKFIDAMSNMDAITADRIKFYKSILNGTVKTQRTTVTYNSAGEIVNKRVETIDDIQQRINARKELDKILGVGQLANLGDVTAGTITINIVDSSKNAYDKAQKEQAEKVEPEEVKIESNDEQHKEQVNE